MDKGRDKPDEGGSAPVVSLQAALRRARLENTERSDGVAALRGAEWARLDLLRETIAPIVAEAAKHSDMFDLALTQGDRPRLFVDMIGFIEMARDRRAYRFLQDTRHGRVLIVESEEVSTVAQAVADYAARRLIEREKALAADALFGAVATAPPSVAKPEASVARAIEASAAAEPPTQSTLPRARPRGLRIFARGFLFLVELLGSATFFAALALGAWYLWAHYAR